MRRRLANLVVLVAALAVWASGACAGARWSPDEAWSWWAREPWIVGADYAPASAVNEIEMWRAETFDPARIDRELTLAQGLGMTTMRVFLHDMLWRDDWPGFRARIGTFLAIADRHGVRPIFVLFDSCWNPDPVMGSQPDPIPGVHNSRWVQSPSARGLADPAERENLERYVRDVVGAFARDPRVLAWDVWNEPANDNGGLFAGREPPDKTALTAALLPQAFAWARAAGATQPLTSGLWRGGENWSKPETLTAIERAQLDQSDILSFHSYDGPQAFERRLAELAPYGRPIVCTEFLARNLRSTIETVLPLAKSHDVGAVNWGLVAGRTQAWLPWDSWRRPYVDRAPPVWQHDLFHPDGEPYSESEVATFRRLTAEAQNHAPPP